jgi:hypothetical protein
MPGRLWAVKTTSSLLLPGHIRQRPPAEHVACWSCRGGSLPFTEFGAATGKASWRKSDTPSVQAPRQITPSAPAAGHQGCCHRRNEHHNHRARPELQVHRGRANNVTEEHQHRRDEEHDLGDAAPSPIFTLKSIRFLPAAENPGAISAAPPTSAKTMKPTNAGVIPNATAAC